MTVWKRQTPRPGVVTKPLILWRRVNFQVLRMLRNVGNISINEMRNGLCQVLWFNHSISRVIDLPKSIDDSSRFRFGSSVHAQSMGRALYSRFFSRKVGDHNSATINRINTYLDKYSCSGLIWASDPANAFLGVKLICDLMEDGWTRGRANPCTLAVVVMVVV